MHSGHSFLVLQSRRRRGPEGPALEFTLKVSARTGLSCMNSFGSLLTLIWGTTNRDALGGGPAIDQARAGVEGISGGPWTLRELRWLAGLSRGDETE
jgi:hypothetical protein